MRLNKKFFEGITKEELDALDLRYLNKFTKWCPMYVNIHEPAGKEHYRLLHYVASKVTEKEIHDLGTYMGLSATMLACNPKNTVLTYDIVDCVPDHFPNFKHMGNAKLILNDCIQEAERISKGDVIMLDVDPHDGIQEKIMYDRLVECGFKGVMLCDDIHQSQVMEEFWNNIAHDKLDVTHLGHYTGTGVVFFS